MRNPGQDQRGPSCPTGPPTTRPSWRSCGWLRPIPSSSCASARLAAAITASPAVECRPTRPVRAVLPMKTTHTTTVTITNTPAEEPTAGGPKAPPEKRLPRPGTGGPKPPGSTPRRARRPRAGGPAPGARGGEWGGWGRERGGPEGEEKRADVGEEGDPAAVGRGAEQPEVTLDELVQEPQPEEDPGGDVDEEDREDVGQDPGAGVEQEVGT